MFVKKNDTFIKKIKHLMHLIDNFTDYFNEGDPFIEEIIKTGIKIL